MIWKAVVFVVHVVLMTKMFVVYVFVPDPIDFDVMVKF
jgi:hypothetical protein